MQLIDTAPPAKDVSEFAQEVAKLYAREKWMVEIIEPLLEARP